MAISLKIPAFVRVICLAFALLVGGGVLNTAFAAEGLVGQAEAAADDAMTAVDPGDSKMAPVMDEANKGFRWSIMLLWGVLPMLIVGILVAWGVMQARQSGIEAAKGTFIAVFIGVVFWFGSLIVFFGA
jgi:hypothetical protein